MATKKELDDMLNDLAGNSDPVKKKKKKKKNTNNVPDDSSLDDLLDALDTAEKAAEDAPKKVRTLDPKEKTQVFGNKSASEFDRKFGKKLKPIPDTPIERPVYHSDEEPSPVKKKKMKIVISDNLPDYEAIRQQELEKDRAAKAAEETRKAEKEAAEKARKAEEEARKAAEEAAEKARIEEEKRRREKEFAKKAALEKQRIAEEKAKEEAILAKKRQEKEEQAKAEAKAAAERMRLAEEKAAEEERLAAEKKRLAKEKAEKESRAAAEAKRIADKKAAKKKELADKMAKLAEEQAALDAEEDTVNVSEDDALKALAESEPEISEELPSVDTIEEDTDTDAAADVDEVIESLGAAAEKPEDLDLLEDPEFAAYVAKKKAKANKKTEKKGLLDRIKALFASDVFDADEQEALAEKPAKTADTDADEVDTSEDEQIDEQMFDHDSADTDELVSEAIAAINEEPVISADETAPAAEAEQVTETAEETPSAAEETKADADTSSDDFSIEEIIEDEPSDIPADEITEESEEEEKGGLVSSLEDILDEDPEELVRSQSEQADIGTHPIIRDVMAKRRKYAVIGVICALLALIGICAILAKGIDAVKNIGNANDKKDRFTSVIYPAAIMDIDAFNTPSELSSEQIITATIWSIIMDKNKIGNYESQLGDTVSIPDVDVEKYAVELFGENIPAFEHCTVGPVEARFYYSNGAYNVKLKPITFTYAPDVRSVVKSGDIYTLTVDYIDELPEWMPKSVAKTVEYQLTEQNDGTFTIDSMRIISVKSSNL